jgi:hypothetical protein
MAIEPVSPAQAVRRRLELQLHDKAMREAFGQNEPHLALLNLPKSLAMEAKALPAAGDGEPDLPDVTGALLPSGQPAFFAGALKARHSLLIDCRALDAAQVRQIWYSWPVSITAAEVACALIVSDPECLVLVADGACLELVPAGTADATPAEKFLIRTRIEFAKRKYGVEKILKAETFFQR